VTIRYIGLEEEEIQASLDKFNPLDWIYAIIY
jgi:hypothetical protein